MVMKKSDIQDEIMNKIQRKIDKDIERMKSKKDMDKSVEKQIRKQLLDLYLFQSDESQKNTKLVDRLNKKANEILEQNERELIINIRNKMSNIEQELEKLDFKFIKYRDTINGHRPVVYCYLNRSSELIDYIGSTGDMVKRINHRLYSDKSPFDKYYNEHRRLYILYILRVCKTREEAYEYEKKFIEVIKPRFNYTWNPNDPRKQKQKKKKQLVNANDYYDLNQWKQLSYELRKKHEICQLCGKNKSTEVHHIFPFMHQFEDVREEIFLDKDNLICLCTDCHHQVHAKNYGNLGIPERMKIEKLRNQISQKYLNQGKILSWL